MKKILPFFSYLFHPVFTPLFGTFFYVWLGNLYFTTWQYIILFLQIAIITILLPIAFFYLMKATAIIDSIMISDISQRKGPLLFHIMLLSVLINRSITTDFSPELHFFILGGIISSALAFLLLYAKIKTSMHMIGVSALIIFIIGLSLKNEINTVPLIAFFVMMNGLVASSRLEMNAHTSKELLVGFICGVLPQIGLLYFWL